MAKTTMDSILSVLATIAIIFGVVMLFNFMIFIHELGHFFAARWRGLYVDRFQIWFGRPIWKKTVNGVQWGLGWIPAGGFVSLPQMAPMEAIEGRAELPKDLKPVTPLDKIIVAAAGPAASFLLLSDCYWKPFHRSYDIVYVVRDPVHPTTHTQPAIHHYPA